MQLTLRQESAISHYLTQNPGVRLSLQGLSGTVYFAEKSSGKQVTMTMPELLEQYDRDRKEAAKERARQRRQEQKGSTLGDSPSSLRRSA
jgi:hypothetical protein